MKMMYFLSLLFVSSLVFAVEPAEETGAGAKQSQVDKNAAKKQPAKQKKQTRKNLPKTFVPSDKIDADSIISFPADI